MKEFTVEEIKELLFSVIEGEINLEHMVGVLNERVRNPGKLMKGDWAIFWDDDETKWAEVMIYEKSEGGLHCTKGGNWWPNVIKYESKEQYNKLKKGELHL